MLKSEFNAKYDSAIRAIAMEEDKDMGTGRDMLIYEAKCVAGVIERVDTYKGVPALLDMVEVYADYKNVTD